MSAWLKPVLRHALLSIVGLVGLYIVRRRRQQQRGPRGALSKGGTDGASAMEAGQGGPGYPGAGRSGHDRQPDPDKVAAMIASMKADAARTVSQRQGSAKLPDANAGAHPDLHPSPCICALGWPLFRDHCLLLGSLLLLSCCQNLQILSVMSLTCKARHCCGSGPKLSMHAGGKGVSGKKGVAPAAAAVAGAAAGGKVAEDSAHEHDDNSESTISEESLNRASGREHSGSIEEIRTPEDPRGSLTDQQRYADKGKGKMVQGRRTDSASSLR